METVTIVGVGLIGGSFALALREAGFEGRILGVSSPQTLRSAVERRVIDQGLSIDEAAPQSDLIYLAQPIGRILDVLPKLAPMIKPGTLVTDAGSTKVAIVAEAEEAFRSGLGLFLGGHPMAGKAERGVAAADANLFRDATYVLTPRGGALPEAEPVQRFCEWVEKTGARIFVLTPETHDRVVAFTSHLPQIASTALAGILLQEIPEGKYWKVAGGGLRDMTRLARSAYELWRDICMTNAGNIEQALSAYIQGLEHLRENLRQAGLKQGFERGAKFADEYHKILQNPT